MLMRGSLTVMKVLRKNQGLSQTDLGNKCIPKMGQNLISLIESKTFEGWPEQLRAIAIALHFPLDFELLIMPFKEFRDTHDISSLDIRENDEEIKVTRDVNFKSRKYGE